VEPSNAWSSLGYVVLGLTMWSTLGRPRDPRLVCIVAAQILIGLGSVAFHGTGTLVGEWLDQLGMFLLSCSILVLAAATSTGWTARRGAWAYALAVAASAALQTAVPPLGIPLFAAQLVAGIAWEVRLYRRARDPAPYRHLFRALAIFAVSFAIWAGDFTGVLCRPDNHVLTGHAVWHLLNAVAVYFVFLFQRERLGPG